MNEAPTTAAELSEEDAFGMVVARTLARLSPRERMLTKKKINDILFEAEFLGSEQITTGHIELSSYNPIYGAPQRLNSTSRVSFPPCKFQDCST